MIFEISEFEILTILQTGGCSSRLVEPLHVPGSCEHLYVLFPGGRT